MTVVIVDLDLLVRQTPQRADLADAGEWDAYHALGVSTSPDPHGDFLVRCLSRGGAILYGVSDRPEKWAIPTNAWLASFALPISNFELRREGDFRPAHEVRADLLSDVCVIEPSYLITADDRLAEEGRARGLYVIQVFRP